MYMYNMPKRLSLTSDIAEVKTLTHKCIIYHYHYYLFYYNCYTCSCYSKGKETQS